MSWRAARARLCNNAGRHCNLDVVSYSSEQERKKKRHACWACVQTRQSIKGAQLSLRGAIRFFSFCFNYLVNIRPLFKIKLEKRTRERQREGVDKRRKRKVRMLRSDMINSGLPKSFVAFQSCSTDLVHEAGLRLRILAVPSVILTQPVGSFLSSLCLFLHPRLHMRVPTRVCFGASWRTQKYPTLVTITIDWCCESISMRQHKTS